MQHEQAAAIPPNALEYPSIPMYLLLNLAGYDPPCIRRTSAYVLTRGETRDLSSYETTSSATHKTYVSGLNSTQRSCRIAHYKSKDEYFNAVGCMEVNLSAYFDHLAHELETIGLKKS